MKVSTGTGNQSGLSLLEMLVVFVVVSLVSVVLLQGFGFGLSLYERVAGRSQDALVATLATTWFRQVNGSLVAPKEPEQGLVGDEESFRAVSINPLMAEPGSPVWITWTVDGGVLVYQEGDQEIPLLELPGDAALNYRDKMGNWHTSWPVSRGTLELPVAVAVLSGGETSLMSLTRMRRTANFVLEESRRERR